MRAPNRFVPFLAALLLGLALVPPAAAETAPAPHIERVAQAGQLWGFVRYLHPYLAYREIDWDKALVDALPRVRDAKSTEEYAAAVQSMLAALGDPATRVLPLEKAAVPTDPPDPGKPSEVVRKLEGGVVLFDLRAVDRLEIQELYARTAEFAKELAAAPAVIVDLRGLGQVSYYVYSMLEQIQGSLVSIPVRAPTQRYLLHSGYRPQDGGSSGGYYSGFLTLAADTFSPPAGASGPPKRVVFLVSSDDYVPTLALALQAAGTGSLVAEGKLGEEAILQTRVLDLGEGVRAEVRVSELMPLPGWPGFHVDAEVPSGESEAALAAALKEARRAPAAAASAAAGTSLPDAVFRLDPMYPDLLEPDLPHRWLAVIRAWNVIHFFYPYLHLLDDWDPVLPEFLARMETAATGRDYALTIQEMMARVADGHTSVSGHPELARFFGDVGLPLEVRWMDGAAVVTGFYHDSARAAGFEIGDAILSVDGEPTEARMERLRKYVAGSTEIFIRQRICSRSLTRGAAGSTAVLSLQGVDGKVRDVRMVRERLPLTPIARREEIVSILPGNIGYIDLTRLEVPGVEAAFEKVKDTRALVFDMRGYPNGTAWSIAPRINTNNARVGAQFRRSQVSAFSAEEGDAGFYFAQPLPPLPLGTPKYTRPTVMLIDDRAISQSEHSGLFYEAANGTRFIGTPTAGANGDVTTFTLPGGILVRFTGHDVRHADGGQLQRKGLIPHAEVSPTRAGLRAGKDEVLERALQDLEQTLAQEAREQEKKAP
jgi:C-terminal processing protease CtpA/Prc